MCFALRYAIIMETAWSKNHRWPLSRSRVCIEAFLELYVCFFLVHPGARDGVVLCDGIFRLGVGTEAVYGRMRVGGANESGGSDDDGMECGEWIYIYILLQSALTTI